MIRYSSETRLRVLSVTTRPIRRRSLSPISPGAGASAGGDARGAERPVDGAAVATPGPGALGPGALGIAIESGAASGNGAMPSDAGASAGAGDLEAGDLTTMPGAGGPAGTAIDPGAPDSRPAWSGTTRPCAVRKRAAARSIRWSGSGAMAPPGVARPPTSMPHKAVESLAPRSWPPAYHGCPVSRHRPCSIIRPRPIPRPAHANRVHTYRAPFSRAAHGNVTHSARHST